MGAMLEVSCADAPSFATAFSELRTKSSTPAALVAVSVPIEVVAARTLEASASADVAVSAFVSSPSPGLAPLPPLPPLPIPPLFPEPSTLELLLLVGSTDRAESKI